MVTPTTPADLPAQHRFRDHHDWLARAIQREFNRTLNDLRTPAYRPFLGKDLL